MQSAGLEYATDIIDISGRCLSVALLRSRPHTQVLEVGTIGVSLVVSEVGGGAGARETGRRGGEYYIARSGANSRPRGRIRVSIVTSELHALLELCCEIRCSDSLPGRSFGL